MGKNELNGAASSGVVGENNQGRPGQLVGRWFNLVDGSGMTINYLLLRGVVRATMVCAVFWLAGAVVAQGAPDHKRFLTLDDAAVAMAKEWQAGRKAKPMMSDDGKVLFAYGQSMPKLTCSPTRACDVEMEAGERISKVILGDKLNWAWAQADSVEKGMPTQHVVIQPRDNNVETNAIITTDRRTYHIKLYAPKQAGVYLNRVGFYYPADMVEAWDNKAAAIQAAKAQDDNIRKTDEAFDPAKMDSDYKIEGNAEFRPIHVFNTGKKVYIEMPRAVFESGETPVLGLIDEDGKANVVDYHPRGSMYIVDRLFTKAVLMVGKEKVTITWGKKAGWTWGGSNPWVSNGS